MRPIKNGDKEDRTPDPLLAKQVLSQLSYTPKFSRCFYCILKTKQCKSFKDELVSSDLE